ncbi:major outer membrane protein OMP-1Z [Ehrlichia chaffeensis str. Arkansas]|uniref:Major outer membrane protein OMP-1Z n=2 Tax=Ehrlichia chaffeensis TaxID=945 RepID=Q2GF65_EHRCR|nr:P44/Msp2 family outer membrane protein [Ehrlichia chaffeensis]AAF73421.1 P28-12 [Ehrlichia chaffeensis]AAK28672.1 major outer membrane protein OMP-1Z [Ehrlichia chaffeensis]ABD45522.1 major outer membrane protein OMP-1Z [Ehrlichia chaffeensis str. Arkansas]AHX07539.1 surface antigen family protein [Ehrlichia chaffeensis str. Osceola]
MKKKNQFITISTILVCLLSLSNASLSNTTNSSTKKQFGLYVSGQYKPSVSIFSNFSVKETNFPTKYLAALKKDINSVEFDDSVTAGISYPLNFSTPYIAVFQDNISNFNGAIGYTFVEGPRIEIEGSYEEFDVKDPGRYTEIQDAYRYFALARDIDSIPTSPKNRTSHDGNSSYKVYHTVMKNEGLSIISIMVNGCYDFSSDNLSILPYVCGGIGVNAIEFFDALHVKFACQGKLGITYPLSSNVSLFAGGYYHQVMGNQFKNLNVQHVAELNDAPKVTSAVATLDIGYFGGEIGARLIF